MKTRSSFVCIFLLLICIPAVAISPFLGMGGLSPWSALIGDDSIEATIFWTIRVPRVCLAFLTGAALSICGVVFQRMLRNNLACPFTLGISGGAAFSTSLYVKLGLVGSLLGISGTSLAALSGAFITTLLVSILGSRGAKGSAVTLLLAGVVVSFFFSSLVILLQYLSDFTEIFRMTRWLMGSLEVVGYANVQQTLIFVVLGLLGLAFSLKELEILGLGDELAQSRGVNVSRARLSLFFFSSLMIAAVVAFCGPIGFVGIIVPHICRELVGTSIRSLLIGSFLFGGCFLVICDTLGRLIIAPYEIPVGVITALLGGPFFLFLLIKRERGISA